MPGKGRPFTRGNRGRPRGAQNKKTVQLAEFLRTLSEDPNYQESLRRRLEAGRAPHVETLLTRDRLGDPKQQIDAEVVIRWEE